MANINILQMIEQCQVEWKTLGSVLVRTKGTKITAGKMRELHKNDGEIKIFAGGKTFAFVHKGDIPDNDINNQPSIIVKSRGIIEFEYYDKPFSHKNEMWSYYSNNDDINIKFIYHFLKQNEPHFQQIGSKMQMPQIATPDTDKFLIPIPPLPIQKEIVKILDKFTELEATLEAELSLREKQYTFYRDHLLTFGDDVEWRRLGEVTLLTNNVKWKNNNRNYRYIDLTSVSRENNHIIDTIEITALNAPSRAQKVVKTNDVIFATTRPTQLRLAFINDEFNGEIVSTGYCVLRASNVVLPRWIYYNLETVLFKNFLEENQSGSAYPSISDSKVKEFKIPIPATHIQEKIVSKLEKFETITNSIKYGLPKAVELYKKQYEYYRNRLLNFSQG
ncbi:TPA: restriction endonuclease subunit S [Pasteurella multocida]|uniref:restriction endonuclease subunit S n=1 Tax=Pasteurella multocida TaxID=747 RepID=UPI00397D01C2